MEALEHHEPPMGFSYSCPHCQDKLFSAEDIEAHSSNCHLLPSPFMIPKIKSYSSLNPQAVDLNFDSEGFPIRREIFEKEAEDCIQDDQDTTDGQDETEESALSNSATTESLVVQDNASSPQKLEGRLARRQKTGILHDSDETEDSDLSKPTDIPEVEDDAPSPQNLEPRLTRQKAKILPESDETEDSILSKPADIPEVEDDAPSPEQMEPRLTRQKAKILLKSDETEDSALSKPADIPEVRHDAHSPQKLEPRLTRQKVKIPYYLDETEDSDSSQDEPNQQQGGSSSEILRDSLKNPDSTCIEDRYICRYCPKTFPYPSTALQHEAKHTRERKSLPQTGDVRVNGQDSLTHDKKSHEVLRFPCCYPGCPRTFRYASSRFYHHTKHPRGQWNERQKRPKKQESNTVPAPLMPKKRHNIKKPTTPKIDKPHQNARATRLKSRKMKSQFSVKTVHCCYPGCPKTFKSTFKRWIHHKTHPKGLWNVRGRRRGWNLEQKKETRAMPPTLPQENENVANNESMEISSMPDLSVKGSMTRSVTKSPTNLELDNVQQQQPAATKDANISATTRRRGRPARPGAAKDANISATTRRRGRPARPGAESEVMTASGRNFKCDLCEKLFPTRLIVRDHRLSHFDTPQLPCFLTGCSQVFFTRIQRVKHVKAAHQVKFRKGKAYIGSRRIDLEPRKEMPEEITPNSHTAPLRSKSPQKIQLNQSPGKSPQKIQLNQSPVKSPQKIQLNQSPIKSDQNTPQGSQADELEEFSTHADNSLGDRSSPDNHEISENKAEDTSSTQLKNSSDDENEKTRDDDRPRDFPYVLVHGKKYYWCDVGDCGMVFMNLEARCLHQKKHETSSEIAQNSVWPDPKKRKVWQKEPKKVQVNSPKAVKMDVDEITGETLLPNQQVKSEVEMLKDEETSAQLPMQNDGEMSVEGPIMQNDGEMSVEGPIMQDDGEMSVEGPMQTIAVVLDDDFEADEQEEMSDFQNESMDTLEFIYADDDDVYNPMEDMSVFSGEKTVQTDDGELRSELIITKVSSNNIAANSASSNISYPTSTKIDKVVQRPPLIKKRKSTGRRAIYPTILVGGKHYFCCEFPGCGGLFNSRWTRYKHLKMHRLGKMVKSKLRLMEDGTVLESAEGC